MENDIALNDKICPSTNARFSIFAFKSKHFNTSQNGYEIRHCPFVIGKIARRPEARLVLGESFVAIKLF